MLIIGILITADSGAAIPQGTIIKEGVLTYPAGPYLSEDLILLSLENHKNTNRTQTADNFSKMVYSKNKGLFFDNNNCSIISSSYGAQNFWVCSPNLVFVNYGLQCGNIVPWILFSLLYYFSFFQ